MTRRRAELGTLKTGDVGDLVRTKISENIVEAARKKRVGDQLVIESNALKNKDDDSIKFYSRGEIGATQVGEGSSIESLAQSEPTYSAVITATAKKYAVYDAITRESIEDARVDVVDGVTEEMGEALANKKDEIILKRLCNDTSTTNEAHEPSGGTFSTDHSPILTFDKLQVVDGGGSYSEITDYSYSPATGSVKTNKISDTGSAKTDYTYSQGNTTTSASKDALAMGDVADAKYDITTNQLVPDKLVVSPRFIRLLEQNSDFVSAHKYVGDLPQGVEGQLYNMDVLVSDNLPNEYIAILVDSDKGMPFLQKTDLNLDRKDVPDEQVLKLYASERYAVGGSTEGSRLLRSNAVAVLAIDHAISG